MPYGYMSPMESFQLGEKTSPAAGVANAIRNIINQHDKMTMMAGKQKMELGAAKELEQYKSTLPQAGGQPKLLDLWKQAEKEAFRQLGGSAWMGLKSKQQQYQPAIQKRFQELIAVHYGGGAGTPAPEPAPVGDVTKAPKAFWKP